MRFREPVNAWSHLVGLLLAAAGTVLLLPDGAQTRSSWLAFAVYGGTLILLYGASTLYHALPLSDRRLRPLRTLDHIAIYFLIAGTYTPVALLTLHEPARLGSAGRRAGDRGGGDSRSRSAGSTRRSGSRPAPTSPWDTWRCWPWCHCRAAVRWAGLAWLVAGGAGLHRRRDHLRRGASRSAPRSVRAPRDLAPPGAARQRVPLRLHALYVTWRDADGQCRLDEIRAPDHS